ncbi:MAG: EAL domain-containing protein [Spirochaetes bacterium]|nr:EAL domain-containing protein [Spirochaetota bacterium]
MLNNMSDLLSNIPSLNIIVPAVCTGIILVSTSLFAYFYIIFRGKSHLTMMITGMTALFFLGNEFLVSVFLDLFNHVSIGMQFYRIQQVCCIFFIICLPMILVNLLTLNKKWQNINLLLTKLSIGIAVIISASAFIIPDSFISLTDFREHSFNAAWNIVRGKQGILYYIRDAVIGLLILYSSICFITDMLWHKKNKNILYLIVGLVFGFSGAIDDMIFVHTGKYISFFPDIHFSRFSIGITLFIITVNSGIIVQFIKEVKDVENAYEEKNTVNLILQESNERFRQLAENINEAFLIYDYEYKVFSYISTAFEFLWKRKSYDLYKSSPAWLDDVHPKDRNFVNSVINSDQIEKNYDIEYRIIHPDKSIAWIRERGFPVKNKNTKPGRLIRIQENITDRKKSEEKLIYLAYYDELTGLLNRTSFFEKLYDVITQSQRETNNIKAVLLISLTDFKIINTTFGDSSGDKILKLVSARLKNCLRETDYIFTLIRSEFAVILKNMSTETDASLVAQKICNELSKAYICDDREIFINSHIGISVFPKDCLKAEDLFKNAHLALFEAIEENNSYKFFNGAMNIKAMEKLTIENSLRHALSKGEFSIYYQPFVNINGKITGMEALLRWNNPSLGNIPPEKFITIAESTRDIITIGEWVLRTACCQLKKWHEDGYEDLRIAVNISAVQLMDKNFAGNVNKIIKETGLESRYLELEITESAVMKNPEKAINVINELNKKGIAFSIDDFGVDYSSLNYVKSLRINRLKIDRSFTMDILTNEINAEITKAVIMMSHNLNIQVTAEGIENIKQKEYLESLGCNELQGYLFSRPLPSDEIQKIIKTGFSSHALK